MATQNFKRNLLLNLYREGKKYISLVCFLLPLKREIKNTWPLQPISIIWRPPSVPVCYPLTRVFSSELVLCIRWPKYWSFNFSISPSNVYSGLISFWIDWFDLLAVQGTLKSLFQHHSSKASILQRSAFFTIQLSHSYMTTGKTIALTSLR